MISIRHREELHLIAVVIPTWVYAILWRSSFVYTSVLIRKSCNYNSHRTQDYQSHSARPYKQRKTPTSEHSGVISLRKLILAPPRGDDIYIPFSYYFCMIFFQFPPEFTTEPAWLLGYRPIRVIYAAVGAHQPHDKKSPVPRPITVRNTREYDNDSRDYLAEAWITS